MCVGVRSNSALSTLRERRSYHKRGKRRRRRSTGGRTRRKETTHAHTSIQPLEDAPHADEEAGRGGGGDGDVCKHARLAGVLGV